MIGAVSGFGARVGGGIGSTLMQWTLLTRTEPRQRAMLAEQPMVKREVAYLRQALPAVDSAEELVKDDRLLKAVLTAFGLEEQAYAKALVRKVLESDLSDPRSFANRISDPRFKELAASFNFKALGGLKPDDPKFVEALANRVLTQRFEEQAGESNEALRLGLYFRRKAGGLSNWYQVLADPALAKVVRTALGLPESIARVNVDRQVEEMKDRFDLAKFNDAKELDGFLKRFVTLWDISGQGAPQQAASPLVGLFSVGGGQPGRTGLDPSTLLAASRLRR